MLDRNLIKTFVALALIFVVGLLVYRGGGDLRKDNSGAEIDRGLSGSKIDPDLIDSADDKSRSADNATNEFDQGNPYSNSGTNPLHYTADQWRDIAKSAQMMLNATTMANNGLIDKAVDELEHALVLDPDNNKALIQAMVLLDDRGQQKVASGNRKDGYRDLIKSGSYARRLSKSAASWLLTEQERAWVGNALYNEACGHCFFTNTEAAFDALELALENGFDKAELIEKDPDLELLRSSPEFLGFLKKISGQKK